MLKLVTFQKQSATAAIFAIEGEDAEIGELLKRFALGEVLKSVPGATVGAVQSTPKPASSAAQPAAPKPAAATPPPATKPPKAAPVVAATAATDDEDDEEDEGGDEIPSEIVQAVKVRQIIDLLVDSVFPAQGKTATVAALTEWCQAHQAKVPALQRLGDTLVDRVQRAASLRGVA